MGKHRANPGTAKIRKYITGVVFLLTMTTAQGLNAETYTIQKILNVKTGISLNSSVVDDKTLKEAPEVSELHTWFAAREDAVVDPVLYSRQYLEEINGQTREEPRDAWKATEVTGNLLGKNGVFAVAGGNFWIRKAFYLPAGIDTQLSVRLGEISDADQTYFNGRLIGQTGDMTPGRPSAYDVERIYQLPPALVRPGQVNVILLKVKSYFPGEAGFYRGDTFLGETYSILRIYYIRNFFDVLLLITYLTVGAYFTFLFFRRLRERENLIFGIFILCLVTYQFLRTQLKYELGLEFLTLKRLEYIVLFFMVPTFYLFIRYFFRMAPEQKLLLPGGPKILTLQYWDYISYGIIAALVGSIIYVSVSDDIVGWSAYNNKYVQFYMFIPLFGGKLMLIINRIVAGERDAIYVLLGLLFVLTGAIFDMISNQTGWNIPRVGGYFFFAFILMLAVILANRFVRLHKEVEDLSKNLERKVEQRTEELQNTLQEVRTLKERQDGDYFLTSLLIKPLGGNFSKSENVNVEMYTRQKKKFVFRRREHEIGGDLNIAYNLRLRERDYTVILNGDAMGKSIQGAGGALVLGTVFKTIISRTSQSGSAANLFPEQWLKNCFKELQDVFVSFDGSMLISLVLGLVDQRTGLLYYINAEHPWVALLRDDRPRFIEEELSLRKVGVEGLEGKLYIKIFQMQANDVIFLGSDGRDDIMLGVDSDGQRIINEDEQEFLKRIKESRGVLGELVENIESQGELIDDFTILRVGYKEDFPPEKITEESEEFQRNLSEARQAFKSGQIEDSARMFAKVLELRQATPHVIKEGAGVMIKNRDYEKAVGHCEEYLEINPADTEFLYVTSIAYKHLQKFSLAADYGERCRLRDPGMVRNLAQLADTYRLMGNYKRAEVMLERALLHDPENERVLRIREKLREKQRAPV